MTKTQLFTTICERVLDEVIKEWLEEHYTIVSASHKKQDSNVLTRKAHLRKKRNHLS